LEKIIAAGVKMVEGYGKSGDRLGNQSRRGGYRDKQPQGTAKWIHLDVIGLTQHMWRKGVSKVDAKLDSISTPITLPANTTQTADNMAADANMTPLNNETRVA
jgi:hypothetical protein